MRLPEPPTMTAEIEVSGRRYIEDRDTAAVLSGSKQRAVTVSIGVAEGSTRTRFQRLYSAADRALYDAKRAGRNKVVFSSGLGDVGSREDMDRDQFAFRWPRKRA